MSKKHWNLFNGLKRHGGKKRIDNLSLLLLFIIPWTVHYSQVIHNPLKYCNSSRHLGSGRMYEVKLL